MCRTPLETKGQPKCDTCAAVLRSVDKPTGERLAASDKWHLRTHACGVMSVRFTQREDEPLSVWVSVPNPKPSKDFTSLDDWFHFQGAVDARDATGPITVAVKQMDGGSGKPALLTAELTAEGLLKGQMVQKAYASLTVSGGKKRKRLPSYYFTGYPVCLGYGDKRLAGGPSGRTKVPAKHRDWVTFASKHGKWGDAFCGQLTAPRVDQFHDAAVIDAQEEARAATEKASRDELRTKAGLPFKFAVRRSEWDGTPNGVAENDPSFYKTPPGFDSGDEAHYNRMTGRGGSSGGGEDEDEVPGADWSGRAGFRCEVCNRRSENVGPRRGFDYRDSVCGGCVELDEMSAEDAARPVPPEKQIYGW